MTPLHRQRPRRKAISDRKQPKNDGLVKYLTGSILMFYAAWVFFSQNAKYGILQCKTYPFRGQNVAFCVLISPVCVSKTGWFYIRNRAWCKLILNCWSCRIVYFNIFLLSVFCFVKNKCPYFLPLSVPRAGSAFSPNSAIIMWKALPCAALHVCFVL